MIEPLACCVRAWSKFNYKKNDSIAVLGVGPTGMMHVLLAKSADFSKIFCLDLNDFRLDFAKKFGVTTIRSDDSILSEIVLNSTEKRGVDIVIVATGNLKAFSQAIQLVRKGGTIVMFGVPNKGDKIEIDILEKEVLIDVYRASGAGGQHVNVTDSAVRITHLPSGIVVQCQAERSQHRNRAMAMKVLQSRLYELERQKQADRIVERQGEKKEIGWGSQIRSYVLQPYQMVKDHRTSLEIGNVTGVLDGQLAPFAEAYLKWAADGISATTAIE